MNISRNSRIQEKRERNKRKALARKVLIVKHRVDGGCLSGFPGIVKYIRHFCPDLSKQFTDGHELIHAFVSGVPQPKQTKKIAPVITIPIALKDDFLQSYEWRRVRMEALKKYGTRCQCCGATPADGVKMNVDHIKPRKLFPQLALDISNLQVLCEVCNHGKGNWDMTDWRQKDGISSQPESVG
jgi:hypothetical protein